MEKINRHNYEAYFLDFAEGNLTDLQIGELEDFLAANPDLRDELNAFEIITLPDSSQDIPSWAGIKKPTLIELQNTKELRDSFFIKAIEGKLEGYDNQLLEKLIQSEPYRKEFELWKKTILQSNSIETINHDPLFQFGLNRPVSDFNYDAYLTAKTEGLLDATQIKALEAFAKTKKTGEADLKMADNLRLEPAAGVFFPDKSKLHREEERKIIPLWFYRAAAVAAIFLFGIFMWNQVKSPSNADQPIAEQGTKTPSKTQEIDTAKTETKSLPDSVKEDNSEKAPQLDEWQMREPDPVEYAENKSSKTEVKKVDMHEIKPIREKANIQVSVAEPEPEMAMLPSKESGTTEIPENVEQSTNKISPYQTLPELAENAFAKKMNVPEENQDEMASIIAKRLTEKASKLLDAEFTKTASPDDENEALSYTLRIGNFKFSHTKTK